MRLKLLLVEMAEALKMLGFQQNNTINIQSLAQCTPDGIAQQQVLDLDSGSAIFSLKHIRN